MEGASASVIAVPKGGGALQAVGETLSPDAHTGTANFSIPLTPPRGRNGFAPQLAVAYSRGSPNGPFGFGMSLAIPGVTPRTAKGIPRYRDAAPDPLLHDVFILFGAEDLVPVESGENLKPCPWTEGLFARIERRLDLDSVVRKKHGLVSRYGVVLPGENDRAVIANQADTRRTSAWKLSATADLCGDDTRRLRRF